MGWVVVGYSKLIWTEGSCHWRLSMLTSESTVHMLICILRGNVCCPLIHDSSFIHFVYYTQPPPLLPISNRFHFLLGITVDTRETENDTCAKGLGGQLYYKYFESAAPLLRVHWSLSSSEIRQLDCTALRRSIFHSTTEQ